MGDRDIIATLGKGGVFDITTTGRKSGEPRRLEIVYHVIDGRLYLSGIPMPTRRSWLANLDADPALTLHLRKPLPAAVAATVRIIESEAERRAVLPHVARNWGRDDIELMVRQSPLVEVKIEPQG
ncbi:MAG TPA: nitroreductase family deazaflavin-dependent oxidoreductase [Candidatus Dormibacteraeota bacterium]